VIVARSHPGVIRVAQPGQAVAEHGSQADGSLPLLDRGEEIIRRREVKKEFHHLVQAEVIFGETDLGQEAKHPVEGIGLDVGDHLLPLDGRDTEFLVPQGGDQALDTLVGE
jgi:hypothetical protein